MQRGQLLGAGGMNVPKEEHVLESIFAPALIPAAPLELLRILESAEDHVPDRNVGKVVGVMAELMMNAM